MRSACSSNSSRVSTFSWPTPRRGSWFTISTSSLDRALAVADDVARHALGGRDQLAVDDQQAVVEALRGSSRPGRRGCARGRSTNAALTCSSSIRRMRDAAAVIGVERLDHHRKADAPRGRGGLLGVVDHALLGHGQAEIAQQLDGLLLVGGELDRDVRRLAGDRGLDALLEAAVAELDQALAVEPQPGDVALLGRRHQRRRAGAQRLALGEADEPVAAALEVEIARSRRPGAAPAAAASSAAAAPAGPPPGRPRTARTRRRRGTGRARRCRGSCRR